MGIKGLRQFLKKITPNAFSKFPLSYFRGKRIAIDISCLMYKYMSVCQGREIDSTNVIFHDLDKEKIFNDWLSMFIHQCITFVESGVTPIYVFDGKPIDEKMEEISRRGEVREAKMSEIKQELRKIRISDEEEFTIEQIKETLEKSDAHVSSLMKQVIDLPGSEKMKLKKIFLDLGIPVVQSKYDAEKTCAMMAIEGLVDMVYSADTDTIVYGAPIVIYEIKKESYNDVYCNVCSMIHYPSVLSSLELNDAQFLDMCISCGTDYNKNIRGIGPVKSHLGIQKYGRIEDFVVNIKASVEEVSGLNYETCRKIFSKCSAEESFVGKLMLTFDFNLVEKCAETLRKYEQIKYIVSFPELVLSMKQKIKVIIAKA